jgi:hypothetical protein
VLGGAVAVDELDGWAVVAVLSPAGDGEAVVGWSVPFVGDVGRELGSLGGGGCAAAR